MDIVFSIIIGTLGCITMLSWATISVTMLIDFFKNRK